MSSFRRLLRWDRPNRTGLRRTGLRRSSTSSPQPPPANPPALEFLGAISTSHSSAFLFAVQVLAGVLLLSGFFVPLALTLLAAELYNILAFHLTLAPSIAPGMSRWRVRLALMDGDTSSMAAAVVHPVAMHVLLALQCFVVLFVALHNWIPLGQLNNVKGVRVAFPTGKLVWTTLLNFTPVAVGLAGTAFYFRRGLPGWIFWWLWITYGLACYGSFKACWLPYLFRPDPALIARYQTMYAGNHSFLPQHNGMRIDTLHLIFDVVTVTMLIDLAVLTV